MSILERRNVLLQEQQQQWAQYQKDLEEYEVKMKEWRQLHGEVDETTGQATADPAVATGEGGPTQETEGRE